MRWHGEMEMCRSFAILQDHELAPLPERSHDRLKCTFAAEMDVGPLGAGLASFTSPTSPFANARAPSDDGERASSAALQPDTLRSKSVSHPPRTPVQLRDHPAEVGHQSHAD
jgi:hypothetical protein